MATSELEIIIGLTDKTKGPLKSITGNLQKVGKIAMGAALGGVAALGLGVVAVARKAIPAASDLVESINAVDKVFGDSNETILAWGKNAAKQAGLAESEFFQMSSQTGAMLQNLGIDQKLAADESINLAKRAADMASIFNTDVADALGAIQAGLRGEADPLERYGVRLSQAAVKAKAMELGLLDATGAMDDQARATASLALLYEQTDAMAGDFVETSGDFANAQRVAKAQLENFMASIGKLALPILGKLFKFVSGTLLPSLQNMFNLLVTGDFEGGIFGLTEDHPFISALFRIREILLGVGEAFGEFWGRLQTGEDIIGSISNLFYNLAQTFGMNEEEAAGVFFAVQNLLETLTNLKDRIMEFLQPILDWVANTVTWKDVLIALGIAIMSVVIPAIISLLAAVLPIVLAIGALILIVALVRKAWEEDWGGIRTKLLEVWENIKPKLELLRQWLEEKIPIAIETLKSFWEDTLLPALQTFWDWVKENVFPKLETLWEWLQEKVPAAIQTLTDFWDNTLYPALEAIWKFLTDDMMPIWEALGELLEVTVGAAIEVLTGIWQNVLQPALQSIWEWIKDKIIPIFDGMSTSVGGVTGAIERIVGWIDSLATAIRNLPDYLPDWITGRSPSPFENSLRGISDAMDELTKKKLPQFNMGLNMLPGLTPAFATMGGPFGKNLATTTAQGRSTSSVYKIYERGGDNVFIQNSAAAAFLVEKQHQAEFDDIDQVL